MATRVTQDSDAACAWACAGAAVLEGIMMGWAPSEAVQAVVSELSAEDKVEGKDMAAVVQQGGDGRMLRGLKGDDGPLALWGKAEEISQWLRLALSLALKPPREAVPELGGRNCHMPNALTTPLHIVLHVEYLRTASSQDTARESTETCCVHDGGQDDAVDGSLDHQMWFKQGVRLALSEGGCCASRAAYVGACLGAMMGPGAVPDAWAHKSLLGGDTMAAAAELCRIRD